MPEAASNSVDKQKLEIKQLRCERGRRTLIRNLSFEIKSGELIQIEGTNGSGKTTLLRTLCNLTLASEGEINWCGENIDDIREEFFANLLYLGHHAGIKDDFTAIENLRFNLAMHHQNISDADLLSALEKIGLRNCEDLPCRQLSAGQRRRVALARLLVSRQTLWILDEPFTAIDKDGTAQLCEIIAQHCQNGGMVILTSHTPVDIKTVDVRSIRLGEDDKSC